jgi:hypothetical protein
MQSAKTIGQSANLLAILDIALEQDIPRRFNIAEQALFIVGESQAGKAKNHGLHAQER